MSQWLNFPFFMPSCSSLMEAKGHQNSVCSFRVKKALDFKKNFYGFTLKLETHGSGFQSKIRSLLHNPHADSYFLLFHICPGFLCFPNCEMEVHGSFKIANPAHWGDKCHRILKWTLHRRANSNPIQRVCVDCIIRNIKTRGSFK